MIQAGKSYVHGTAAEKLDYDVYQENKVLRKKRIQRSNSKAKFKFVCTILLAFSMLFVIMYRYAAITELNYNVYKLNKQYTDIKNENSSIRVSIEKQLDLDNIRQIAESRLGMQKPDKFQVAYVKVEKHDYTRVADQYKGRAGMSGENMFANIMDKVSQFSRFLY